MAVLLELIRRKPKISLRSSIRTRRSTKPRLKLKRKLLMLKRPRMKPKKRQRRLLRTRKTLNLRTMESAELVLTKVKAAVDNSRYFTPQ